MMKAKALSHDEADRDERAKGNVEDEGRQR